MPVSGFWSPGVGVRESGRGSWTNLLWKLEPPSVAIGRMVSVIRISNTEKTSTISKIYLIVLLLIPRHIIIYITTCAFNCKNTVPDGGNHIELLNHRIHVTSSTGIFQPHKSFRWAGSNRWQVFPLSKCFTSWKIKSLIAWTLLNCQNS